MAAYGKLMLLALAAVGEGVATHGLQFELMRTTGGNTQHVFHHPLPLFAMWCYAPCSTATNWIANMIVGATFLTMLNTLGNANTFWVYAALNVLFILLTLWLVPETKHVSLEHIERNLMKGRKLREIGAHD